MYQSRPAPDGRWLSFKASREPSYSEVFVALYRPGEPATESEWIPVSDIPAWDDKPRWSSDGSLLYFTSDRDGFRCIWARRLNPETKRPVGPPFDVYHSHNARRSLLNVGLGWLAINVARDKLVFVLGERTGNIWTAELREE